ncbi:hypothetical protein V8C34DRAFT_137458 [Trichoderma compactum]
MCISKYQRHHHDESPQRSHIAPAVYARLESEKKESDKDLAETASREAPFVVFFNLRRCTQPCQDNDHDLGNLQLSLALLELRRCTQPCQDNDHVLRLNTVSFIKLRRCTQPCQDNDHALSQNAVLVFSFDLTAAPSPARITAMISETQTPSSLMPESLSSFSTLTRSNARSNDYDLGNLQLSLALLELRRCTQPCQDNDHVLRLDTAFFIKLRRCTRPC